jgi:hypothetical protein
VSGNTVSVPIDVLQRALRRARHEFVRLAVLTDEDPGDGFETWPEFERLAEYLDEGPGAA